MLECVGEDGKQSTITLGTIERLAGRTTAENLESIFRNRSRLRTVFRTLWSLKIIPIAFIEGSATS
jgi:hypothetical protein